MAHRYLTSQSNGPAYRRPLFEALGGLALSLDFENGPRIRIDDEMG